MAPSRCQQELEGTWLGPVEFADLTGVVALGTSTQACVLGASNLERGWRDEGWGGRGGKGGVPMGQVQYVVSTLKARHLF